MLRFFDIINYVKINCGKYVFIVIKGTEHISTNFVKHSLTFLSLKKKMDIASPTPQDLQRKLYFLVEQLQHMAGELPPKYQMRLPYELLSGLANSLLNDTIFEIVKGLMEIQHVTEKHLFQQRLQLLNQQKIECQEALSATMTDEQLTSIKVTLYKKHKEELKQMDMKLVLQLDQKVADQQSILEKAGVPGFYVTNNPVEIQVQMRLCDFIIRLSKMDIPT